MAKCVICGSVSSTNFCSKGDRHYLQCNNCSHVYEQDIVNKFVSNPAQKQKSSHHTSEIKTDWDFSDLKKTMVFNPRLEKIKLYSDKGKLLDIGCSNGAFIEAAKDYGWEPSGVELLQSSAHFAQQRGLKVYTQPLHELRLEPESYTAITMWQVLEHLTDPVDFLKECWRLLKPSGVIAFSTPNIKSISWKLLRSSWPAIEPGNHHHLFSPQTIRRMFKDCGFNECQVETIDIQPATVKQIRKKLIKKNKTKQTNSVAQLVKSASQDKMSRLFKMRQVLNVPLKFTNLGEDIYGIFIKP